MQRQGPESQGALGGSRGRGNAEAWAHGISRGQLKASCLAACGKLVVWKCVASTIRTVEVPTGHPAKRSLERGN